MGDSTTVFSSKPFTVVAKVKSYLNACTFDICTEQLLNPFPNNKF